MVRTDHPFLRVGRHRVNISRRWQRGGGQHFALLGWGRWFHEECGLGLGKDKSRARKRASQEMVNRSGWGDILNLLFLGAALAGDGGDGGGRCGVKKGRWHWGERSEMKMRRERGGLALKGGRGRNNISLHRRRVKMQIAHSISSDPFYMSYMHTLLETEFHSISSDPFYMSYMHTLLETEFSHVIQNNTAKYIRMPKCIARWAQPLSMKIYSHASNQLLEIM
jgi:hypothetical protein